MPGIAPSMTIIPDLPKMLPRAIVATFQDELRAEVAIHSLLQAGIEESQISLIPAQAQHLTPANDPSVYRATGLNYSPSAQDSGNAPDISELESGDSSSSKYAVVMVQPMGSATEGLRIRQLLIAAGGQLAQRLDTEAA